ncbi:membrane protein insertion efficiency factor YidD [Lichenihabitans sp. PAMC28606]|uniref:membrane protein insertion efficiency factor YidD n=1 Tax=Lichenihabitans sp. PAMC28606 TaxID=2880932 RepID=UPI001D0ABAE2|nr:membrane protein insertion efficiency factor YidD [Lichenihabitans sp. PAMC28606]UDL95671.1 membrane protein insertion efficiency factor YidD [Lichenihabitans sp. PAMC28606]
MNAASRLLRGTAHGAIRAYQLTLSGLSGRQCRYLPTCSDFTDEAIQRHGLWAGGWMGLSRICRCHPWGDAGFDPVPATLPPAAWFTPWRFGAWRKSPAREAYSVDQDRAKSSAAKP